LKPLFADARGEPVGASPRDAHGLMVGEGLRPAGVGVFVGTLLAASACWALAGWVYGVRAFEPSVMIGATLVLTATLLLASYLPARRAAAIAPMVALRQD